MTNTPRRCGWRWKRLPSCSSGPRGSAGDTHTLRHFPHHLPRTTNHANIGTATTPLEVLMANIVNLTPHPVTLVTANGDEVVIQPEAVPVRIPAETKPAGEINDIPVVEERLGNADDVLPAPQQGVVYVVSRPVAERANRPDLLVPTSVERVNGRPVRARALARVATEAPRTAAADTLVRVAETAIAEDRDRHTGLRLLEYAVEVRRGSVAAFQDGVRELTIIEQMQFISAQLRRETRAALETLRGIESAYTADVQSNPPVCRPCGGFG